MNDTELDTIDFSTDYSGKTSKQFAKLIMEFNKSIGNDYEIILQVPNITKPILLNNVTFCKPNLVVLDGILDSNPIRLIQSLSQLCVGILAKKRLNPNLPKQQIGFQYQI